MSRPSRRDPRPILHHLLWSSQNLGHNPWSKWPHWHGWVSDANRTGMKLPSLETNNVHLCCNLFASWIRQIPLPFCYSKTNTSNLHEKWVDRDDARKLGSHLSQSISRKTRGRKSTWGGILETVIETKFTVEQPRLEHDLSLSSFWFWLALRVLLVRLGATSCFKSI